MPVPTTKGKYISVNIVGTEAQTQVIWSDIKFQFTQRNTLISVSCVVKDVTGHRNSRIMWLLTMIKTYFSVPSVTLRLQIPLCWPTIFSHFTQKSPCLSVRNVRRDIAKRGSLESIWRHTVAEKSISVSTVNTVLQTLQDLSAMWSLFIQRTILTTVNTARRGSEDPQKKTNT